MCSRACWPCWASWAASATDSAPIAPTKALRGLFLGIYPHRPSSCGQTADNGERCPLNNHPCSAAFFWPLPWCHCWRAVTKFPAWAPTPALPSARQKPRPLAVPAAMRCAALKTATHSTPKPVKAAVFTGWKDMDQYMRENKIEGTPSVLDKSHGAEKRRKRDRNREPGRPRRQKILIYSRSNTAMLSTWAVCGNMLTMPAAVQR